MVEKLAQVGLGLLIRRVGPKEKGNLLARLRLRRVEEKIAQERLLPITEGGRRSLAIL